MSNYMRFASIFILATFLNFSVYGLEECIGPKDSKTVVVYLHGMDMDSLSNQEMENRKIITKISESLKIGFALPRAKDKCPNSKQICWGWNFNESGVIDSIIESAEKTKNNCFPKAKTVGLIGFSNGGYAVNQIVKDCRKTNFNWLISIGAGASPNKTDKKDLQGCGVATLMAGKSDKYNYEPIKELGKWFTERKADVKVIEYDGGHELKQNDLEAVLKSYLSK